MILASRVVKRPVRSGVALVAVCGPGVDGCVERGGAGEALIQALAREDAQLDLGHVEPTAAFGRVHQTQSTAQATGGWSLPAGASGRGVSERGDTDSTHPAKRKQCDPNLNLNHKVPTT